MASAFAFMPFLIGRFGLSDYGLFLLAGSLSGYMGLMDLGVGASVVKYVAEHRARGENRELGEILSTSLVFYVVVGLAAALVLVLVAQFAHVLFRVPPQSASLVRNLFLLSAGVSVFTWPTGLAAFVLAGHQRYDLSARVSIGAMLGNILVTYLVIVMHQGPFALLACTSLVSLMAAGANIILASRELRGIPVRLGLARMGTLRSIFRFSSVILVTQVCSLIIYQQTDRLVLGVFVGASAIALYEAASRLQAFVQELAGMMASAVMPTASHLNAQSRDDALRALFLRGTKYTVIFVTPIAVTLMVLAEPLLRTWLGPSFVPMAFGTQLFVSYWLLNANTTVSGSILTGTGKLKFLLLYTVAGTLANLVLSVVLVQRIGLLGVIVGTVVPYYVGFPIYMRYMMKQLGVPAREWLREVVARPYPLLLLPLTVAIAGERLGWTRGLLGVAAVGMASVLVYWAAAYGVAIRREERIELMGLVLPGRLRRTSVEGPPS
jgi:O-antigen/teichoic acid export membrane protein